MQTTKPSTIRKDPQTPKKPSKPQKAKQVAATVDPNAVPETAKSFHTFVTNNKTGPVEYAIKPSGQVVRLTPKPLNKKQRRKLFKQHAA